MPIVPTLPASAQPTPSGPRPSPAQLLMALATMKDLGRLDANAPTASTPKELMDSGVKTAEDELFANKGAFGPTDEERNKRRNENADKENNLLSDRKKKLELDI